MAQIGSNPAVGRQRDDWDPGLYVGAHSFVFELGEGVLELAAVRAGERVLDVGCGTGELTARIAEAGAEVLGVDSSRAMVAAAREAHPSLEFEVANATALEFDSAFDLVFSNAVLHWVMPPQDAADSMARALRPGGRLVAEFGGAGNLRTVRAALDQAMAEAGVGPTALEKPWYYPTIPEYTRILANAGLNVTYAHLFERPTPLEGEEGLRNWLEMFVRPHFADVPPETAESVLARATEIAEPELRAGDTWRADYVRLQVVARSSA